MTQVPSPATVIGRFDGAPLRADTRAYRPVRRAGQFLIEISDPDTAPARTSRPVALVTGSHHMQLFWFPSGRGRELSLLPFAYLREEQRWIPRSAAFLKPPGDPDYWGLEAGHWNTNCIHCHATAGRISVTGRLADLDSRVAEFGIACEACHGPAARHVALHRDDPGHAGKPEAALVDPSQLPGRRSAQICGQCHGIVVEKTSADFPVAALLARGHRYRPGDDLDDTRMVAGSGDPAARAMVAKLSGSPTFVEDSFWSDGMVRVSGREYNGLIDSPCARNPAFSCLSCHQLHPNPGDRRPRAVWADDQLAPDMDGDHACVQCHDRYRAPDRLAAHSHHPTGSTGSRCTNCHMPYTTYGLLKAIRSHQVSSPNVKVSLATGRPNACNQCHLDRTSAWTAGHLHDWYDSPLPALSADDKAIAASLLWLLRGDAGQRALAAWSFGWAPAHKAAGATWLAAPLARLLDDPYDAVRFIACRSMRRLPGFANFACDFLAPPSKRLLATERALAHWRRVNPRRAQANPAIIVGPDGEPDGDVTARLVRQRDNRPVRLQE